VVDFNLLRVDASVQLYPGLAELTIRLKSALFNRLLVVQRAEWEAAVADVAGEHYTRADVNNERPRRLLDGEWDIFGDGRVGVTSTVGHTAGHQSLRIITDDTRELILCGDACYLRRSLDTRSLPTSSFNASAQLAGLEWLDERERSGAYLVFGHDPGQWPTDLADDRVIELTSIRADG
jgi:glyoxylase-like metal-dependent hydrolase (beta-lactamase superfamily II)